MMKRDGRLHFPGTEPMPELFHAWGDIAAAARDALEQRRAEWPRMVEAGTIERDVAERRIGILAGIASLWGDVLADKTLPDEYDYPDHYGATIDAMRGEAHALMLAAQARAEKTGDYQWRRRATLFRAMAWNLSPSHPEGGISRLWQAHEFAQWENRQAFDSPRRYPAIGR